MSSEEPFACALDAGDLGQRLAAIAAAGSESLIDRSTDGDRQLLRFRSAATSRRRLEAIIAAEAECCPFLDLSLSECGGELLLSIDAPGAARELSAGLAAAFGSVERLDCGRGC